MSSEKEMKYVSWTWIVSVLLGILMLVGGFILNDTRATICQIQEGKLDRKEYIKDFEKRNQDIQAIHSKLDQMMSLLIRHMERSK
jgi:hypothetical protein